MPKSTLNTTKKEIAKVLKMTENTIEIVNFIYPTKQKFVEDLHPDLVSLYTITSKKWYGDDAVEE